VAREVLAATGQGRLEAFLPRNHLPADLAAGMVGQGMNVHVGVATANVGQQLRERMPEEWADQAVRGNRSFRKQPIDLAGGGRGLEQEGNNRSVDPRTVQVNVGLENTRYVEDAQPIPERLPIFTQPECREASSQ